jgi:hypothetical protein
MTDFSETSDFYQNSILVPTVPITAHTSSEPQTDKVPYLFKMAHSPNTSTDYTNDTSHEDQTLLYLKLFSDTMNA